MTYCRHPPVVVLKLSLTNDSNLTEKKWRHTLFNLSYSKLFENPKQFVPTFQQYKENYIYKSWNISPVNHFTAVDIIT